MTGYLREGAVVSRWGVLKDEELPGEQMEKSYLARIYHDLPYRTQEEVRRNAYREAKARRAAIRAIVVFVIGVPVLIELASLGITWLGYLLAAISIFAGFRKLGKSMGWLKASKKEKSEEEKKLKMKHYFYHSERNPNGFLRLKIENFKHEAIEKTREEAEKLFERTEFSNACNMNTTIVQELEDPPRGWALLRSQQSST